MKRPRGKSVDESRVEMVEVVLPNDANPLGNILGGKVMHLIDIFAKPFFTPNNEGYSVLNFLNLLFQTIPGFVLL